MSGLGPLPKPAKPVTRFDVHWTWNRQAASHGHRSESVSIGHPDKVCDQVSDAILDSLLAEMVSELFPLTPWGIIDHLRLRKPIYRRTAMYGHFGSAPTSDGCFRWERTDMAAKLKKTAGGTGPRSAGRAARG